MPARAFMQALGDEDAKVLDTSTAFRTDPGFAYGFPELSTAHEEAIVHSSRVANTGCHAAGAIALLYPLLAAGVISARYANEHSLNHRVFRRRQKDDCRV